ncbi:receptor-type tyrosine-protein phosphatase V isoform X3 [Xenopus laevis]|uniref:Receptor-type tyrosine-protein phosphatase V isoform X3 n=1 Tax=Xenopus laevis TaxID=8355 RepID=A0A8J0UDF5_XENLA|nr:receptor-type tyrosine-protein phosphatase V isoform X3 [Xenopus laevis]
MESRDFFHAIPVCSFQEFFYMKQKDENNRFLQEFKELTDVGNDQSKKAAETPANAMKNRYAHILPYDHSRVKLSLIDGNLDSLYINANYIPVLCDQYWPADTDSYGHFAVHKVSELPSKDWTIRHFTIQKINNADTSVRSVCQLHYRAWPDRGVPLSPASLITFVELVREQLQAAKDSTPTVLHCSAGVGRTGTFIALDVALQQLRARHYLDIFHTVHQMRLNRYLMLQTVEQYIFVHYCIIEKIVQMEAPHTFAKPTITRNASAPGIAPGKCCRIKRSPEEKSVAKSTAD